ncbi:MAG: 50S ribosomal protein L11 methyltransferase [Pseudomonadota bacterium]
MTATPLWHVTARVPLTAIDAVVDLFERVGFSGVSWIECDDAPPSEHIDDNGFPISSEFALDGYTANKPDLDFLNGMVESLSDLLGVASPVLTLSIVDNTDWLLTCYQSMPARTVGDFYVYGSHIEEAPPTGLFPVLVNAATAFGSGEHPTTTGCLTALSAIAYDAFGPDLSILDMGCGSGILGIAAKKKWPKATVTAVDNDAESVRVTVQNAHTNETVITAIESMGFANDAVSVHAPYHIVLANILAKPLIALAPDFATHMHCGGIVIVSGLLSRHAEDVTKAYVDAGFAPVCSHNLDDWMTLVFKKT